LLSNGCQCGRYIKQRKDKQAIKSAKSNKSAALDGAKWSDALARPTPPPPTAAAPFRQGACAAAAARVPK